MFSICPLKFVDAVLTQDNVYINVQKDMSLAKTKWDIENKKLFTPFMR